MKNLVFALIAAATLLTAPAAPAATLHSSVVVSDNYVRLGDLFTDTGDKSDTVVAYAPAPGRTANFDARWLYRIAYAYGVAWRPLSDRDHAVVRRDSQIVPRKEILDRIEAALVEHGADPSLHAVLSNRSLQIYVPSTAQATVEVEDATFDAQTRRFTATISAPAGDPAARHYRLTGSMHVLRKVPVLTRQILSGEIIRADDLQWVPMRADTLQRDIIVDADDLIGKSPRRPLKAGQAVHLADVRRPVMVAKGSLVNIVLSRPNMVLTAKGIALQNGSKGDAISVSNTQSHLVVQATVTGPNMVTVTVASRLALN